MLRIVIASAHGTHGTKAANADGNQRGFRSAGEHHLRVAHFDGAPGLADGMVRGRTGGAGGEIGPAQMEEHGDQAGRHVGDQHGDHEGRKFFRATPQQDLVLFSGGLQATDARTEDHSDFVTVFLSQIKPGILQGGPGGVNTKLGITVGAADFLGRRKCGRRVKVPDLATDPGLEGSRIKRGDLVDAAGSGDKFIPESVEIMTDRGYDPHAGYDDATAVLVM